MLPEFLVFDTHSMLDHHATSSRQSHAQISSSWRTRHHIHSHAHVYTLTTRSSMRPLCSRKKNHNSTGIFYFALVHQLLYDVSAYDVSARQSDDQSRGAALSTVVEMPTPNAMRSPPVDRHRTGWTLATGHQRAQSTTTETVVGREFWRRVGTFSKHKDSGTLHGDRRARASTRSGDLFFWDVAETPWQRRPAGPHYEYVVTGVLHRWVTSRESLSRVQLFRNLLLRILLVYSARWRDLATGRDVLVRMSGSVWRDETYWNVTRW